MRVVLLIACALVVACGSKNETTPPEESVVKEPDHVEVDHILVGRLEAGKVDIAENACQQVVEIVSNAAGKKAHGFKLLGALHFVLQAGLFCNVTKHAAQCHRLVINKTAVHFAVNHYFPAGSGNKHGLC